MLYGATNEFYERALQSHKNHSARHGNPMDILRNDVASGYWNKPSYILSVLVQELSKDPCERVQWLM